VSTPKFVICPNCQTKYKRPANVPDSGIKVKCKSCGNIFDVKSDDRRGITGRREKDQYNDWLIKKTDGTILRAKDLSEIQRKIVEMQVSEQDELSKSGDEWEKLGDIENFISFFSLVNRAKNSSQTANPPSPEIVKNSSETLISTDDVSIEPEINEEALKSSEAIEPDLNDIAPKSIPKRDATVEIAAPSPSKDELTNLFSYDDDDDFSNVKKRGNKTLPLLLVAAIAVIAAGYFFIQGAGNSFISKKPENSSSLKKTIEPASKEIPTKEDTATKEAKTKEEIKKVETGETTEKVLTKKIEKVKKIEKKPKTPIKKALPKKVKKSGGSAKRWIKKGWNLIDSEKSNRAIKAFRKALLINPDAADAYIGLGEAYNMLGNKAEAKKNYKKYLKLKPGAPDSAEIRSVLKNLQCG